MKCDQCGGSPKKEPKLTKTGKERLPKGWKRHAAAVWCVTCWKKSFRLRAVTIPVVGPVGRSWPELRQALKSGWSESTALANWLMRQLYLHDVRRKPGDKKMPARPTTYLYPETGAIAPNVSPRSRTAMEQAITAKYSESRYKIVWTGEQSLPTFRYPYPYPVSNQEWQAEWLTDDDGGNRRPVVSIRLADERWTLQLRGGSQYRRQLTQFEQIVSGEAVQGELAIYRKRANGADHRNGVDGRDSGGQRQQYRVMCKMVAWLPKAENGRTGTLYARTDSESLLVALNAKEERLWLLNGDHVRRWVAEHRRKLDRWGDDQKAEQRRAKAKYQSRREAAVKKFRNRMDSAIKEAASQLVAFAARRRLATIEYRDDDQRFVDRFPYHELRERIKVKCEDEGIEFVHASGAEA